MESYAVGSSQPAPWAPDVDLEAVAGTNAWPDSPADFQPKVARYFAAVEEVVGQLMRVFALALRSLTGSWVRQLKVSPTSRRSS